MEMKKKLILSPVGISLLLNSLRKEESEFKRTLLQESNALQLPEEIQVKVDDLVQRATKKLQHGSVSERRKLSAELNSLYALYENDAHNTETIHILLKTDTALGEKSAEILEKFLREEWHSPNIISIPVKGLNTASLASFSRGIKNLLKKFDKMIPDYKEKGYEIIFNLTGGFKSLQGYLNIIGMFYADRLVYIFERSSELLTIPKLPIKIDEEKLYKNATKLALLDEGVIFSHEELSIGDALLDIDEENNVSLSEWGQLAWYRVKRDIFSKELVEFPHIIYEQSFKKDFEKTKELRVRMQESIAKASAILLDNNGDITALKRDGGLKYDDYSGKNNIGHFRIDDGNRITCVYKKEKLYLRHFGSHNYTQKIETGKK